MAKNFQYKARDRSGHILSGVVLAEDQTAAATYVREQGYFVTSLQEEKSKTSTGQLLKSLRRVKTKDLAVMCRQFSTMINAGMPILSCVNILVEQCENSLLKEALQDCYKQVREGDTLSRALGKYPRIFPPLMFNLIEAGELGGVLDDVLERLAAHFEKEHKLNEKVKSAMVYPAVVMGIAFLVVVFILTFVLPTFTKMFADMHVELPFMTKLLLAVSDVLQHHFLVFLLGLGGLSYGVVFALRKPSVRKQFDQLVLRLPVIGILTRKISIARFSRTLSTLLRGGVPIIVALEVVEKILGNLSMTEAMRRARIGLREGQGLAQTLGASRVFTPMTVQMVSIGEESGSLDQMLEKVADFYDNEVEDMVGRLNSLIEPLIIVFLGITIGSIVIAIMLPMFDIMSGAGVSH